MRLFLWSLIVFLTASLASALEHNPLLPWQVCESEHFRIIYLPEQYDIVSYNVAYFERQSQQINQTLGITYPPDKIDLILNPHTDQANGYANIYLGYTIQINLAYPQFMALSFNDWIRFVFIHEYTHIAQLRGPLTPANDLCKKVIGLSPEYLQQSYALEGLAVFYESMIDPGGRLHSGNYQKYIRTDAFLGLLPGETELANPFVHRMPGPEAKYIYSAAFFAYLDQSYGPEKLAELVRNLVNSYSFRDAFFNVYHKNLSGEIVAWHRYEVDRTRRFMKASGAQMSAPISFTGGAKKNLRQLNAKELLYIDASNPDKAENKLVAFSMQNHTNRTLLNDIGFEFNLSPSKKYLVYTQYEWKTGFDQVSNLYTCQLDSLQRQRVQGLEHVFNPDFGQDEHTLFYVRYEQFIGNIYRYNMTTGTEDKLTQNKNYTTTYKSPHELPDGRIVGIRYMAGRGTDLIALAPNSGKETTLLAGNDYAMTLADLVVASSNSLYLEAEKDEVQNIYTYDIATCQLSQIRNALGGPFSPVVIEDKLFFLDYVSGGTDICKIPNTVITTLGPSAPALVNDSRPSRNDETLPVTPVNRPYNPFTHVHSDLIGSTLYLNDTLLEQEAQLGIDPLYWTSPQLIAGYSNSQFGPRVGLSKNLSSELAQSSIFIGDTMKNFSLGDFALGWKFAFSQTHYPNHDHTDTRYRQLNTYISNIRYPAYNFFPYKGGALSYNYYQELLANNTIQRVTALSWHPLDLPSLPPFTLALRVDAHQSAKATWFPDYSVRGYRSYFNDGQLNLKNFIQFSGELRHTLVKTSQNIYIGAFSGISHKAFFQNTQMRNQVLNSVGYEVGCHLYFFNIIPITLGYALEVPLSPYPKQTPAASSVIEVVTSF